MDKRKNKQRAQEPERAESCPVYSRGQCYHGLRAQLCAYTQALEEGEAPGMFSRVWQLCCLPIARVRHWASTVFQWIRKWSLACRPSQNGSRSTSLTRSVSSEDDIRRPLLEGETTELSVHQCNFFELLVFGSVTDGASLDFFIYQPSTLLTSPVFAFTAPITSFQVLEKCFQLVTGVNTELVRCHMGPNPLQFQMMRVSGWNRSSSNCSTFIASAGWPDLTGGSALSAPCLTDIDKLNAVQTSLISQLADCTVIVVERLTRLDVLFLTKFMRRQKWVIIWHNLESTEEFKVCGLFIY